MMLGTVPLQSLLNKFHTAIQLLACTHQLIALITRYILLVAENMFVERLEKSLWKRFGLKQLKFLHYKLQEKTS